MGHTASIHATVAVTQHDVETILAQSQRALAYLAPQPAGAHGHHLDSGASRPPPWQETLQLIAQGLSNRETGERLFLAFDTVKGHNRRICKKLAVQRRIEAIARARSLNLL